MSLTIDQLERDKNKPKYSARYLDQRSVVSMYAHSAATLEDLAKELMLVAGVKFGQGNDLLAKYLRDELIPELRMKAVAKRGEQKKAKEVLDKVRKEMNDANKH